jgi:hypothetical protein
MSSIKTSETGAELREIGFNKKELYSEIDIDASSETVWKILSDFVSYPQWNPFMRSIKGDLRKGGKLTVLLQPSGSRGTTFNPTVLTVDPNRELRWIGHLFFPGLFDGEHILEIQSLDEGKRVRFIQRELFGGIFLPFLTGMLRKDTSRGFTEMNRALKQRAETGTTQ